MLVREVTESGEKERIARLVLEALPDWFGIAESRENYIRECADLVFFAAFDEELPVGFVCLKETGKDTAELSVMGVRKEYHGKGIGTELFRKARERAVRSGYSFLQVKTVRMGEYPEYDDTNRFYISLGFREFEVFPSLWDENNPCQVYVMSIRP